MRESFQSKITAITIFLILFLSITLLPGCIQASSEIKIAANVNELSLVGLWDQFLKQTGIAEQMAYLHSFRLETDTSGQVYIYDLHFTASDNDSKWTDYWIIINDKGQLQIRPDKVDNIENSQLTYNPCILFAEIDNLGLKQIQSGSTGFLIEVQPGRYSQSGKDPDYVEYIPIQDHLLISQLKDGKLTPLKYVKFNRNQSYLHIQVDKHSVDYPPEIWFLNEDLGQASVVQYSD